GSWTNSGTLRIGSNTSLELGGTLTTARIGTIDRSGNASIKLTATLDNTGSTLDLSSAGKPWSTSLATISGGTLICSAAGSVSMTGTLNNSVLAVPNVSSSGLNLNQTTLSGTTLQMIGQLKLLNTNVLDGDATIAFK